MSPGPDYIHLSQDFTELVRVRILSTLSPDPGPDFIKVVRIASRGPNFIHRIWVRMLFLFESGSGFYQVCPGPCPDPDFTNTPDLLRFYVEAEFFDERKRNTRR